LSARTEDSTSCRLDEAVDSVSCCCVILINYWTVLMGDPLL